MVRERADEIRKRADKLEEIAAFISGEPQQEIEPPKQRTATRKRIGANFERVKFEDMPEYLAKALAWCAERPGEEFQAMDMRDGIKVHPRSIADILTKLVKQGKLRQIGKRTARGPRTRYVYNPEDREVVVE